MLGSHAAPGAEVTLFLGLEAVVLPEPGVEAEQLCERLRAFLVGSVPAAGAVDHTLLLPAWMTPGQCLFAQAQVRPGDGELSNTSSVPMVAR